MVISLVLLWMSPHFPDVLSFVWCDIISGIMTTQRSNIPISNQPWCTIIPSLLFRRGEEKGGQKSKGFAGIELVTARSEVSSVTTRWAVCDNLCHSLSSKSTCTTFPLTISESICFWISSRARARPHTRTDTLTHTNNTHGRHLSQ